MLGSRVLAFEDLCAEESQEDLDGEGRKRISVEARRVVDDEGPGDEAGQARDGELLGDDAGRARGWGVFVAAHGEGLRPAGSRVPAHKNLGAGESTQGATAWRGRSQLRWA
jgi:hypothetical protein